MKLVMISILIFSANAFSDQMTLNGKQVGVEFKDGKTIWYDGEVVDRDIEAEAPLCPPVGKLNEGVARNTFRSDKATCVYVFDDGRSLTVDEPWVSNLYDELIKIIKDEETKVPEKKMKAGFYQKVEAAKKKYGKCPGGTKLVTNVDTPKPHQKTQSLPYGVHATCEGVLDCKPGFDGKKAVGNEVLHCVKYKPCPSGTFEIGKTSISCASCPAGGAFDLSRTQKRFGIKPRQNYVLCKTKAP